MLKICNIIYFSFNFIFGEPFSKYITNYFCCLNVNRMCLNLNVHLVSASPFSWHSSAISLSGYFRIFFRLHSTFDNISTNTTVLWDAKRSTPNMRYAAFGHALKSAYSSGELLRMKTRRDQSWNCLSYRGWGCFWVVWRKDPLSSMDLPATIIGKIRSRQYMQLSCSTYPRDIRSWVRPSCAEISVARRE